MMFDKRKCRDESKQLDYVHISVQEDSRPPVTQTSRPTDSSFLGCMHYTVQFVLSQTSNELTPDVVSVVCAPRA